MIFYVLSLLFLALSRLKESDALLNNQAKVHEVILLCSIFLVCTIEADQFLIFFNFYFLVLIAEAVRIVNCLHLIIFVTESQRPNVTSVCFMASCDRSSILSILDRYHFKTSHLNQLLENW